MKTPEEVFKEMSIGDQAATRWIELIRQAQREAIEETVRQCSDISPLDSPDFYQVECDMKKELGL